jgi:hypothetical protein
MIRGGIAGDLMKRFVEGVDRGQSTLFPERLEDWIIEDNPVRVIDVFVEELDLGDLGYDGVDPHNRSAFVSSVGIAEALHCGYLNRVQ